MRAVVFILLPWLLLLPLSWGLDLSSCETKKNVLSRGNVTEIQTGNSCQGDWHENGTLKFQYLKGFVRRVADACFRIHGNSKWRNKAVEDCALSTVYNRGCNPYEVEYSQPVPVPTIRSSKKYAYPFELVCEYLNEKVIEESSLKSPNSNISSSMDCKQFHFDCEEKFDKQTKVSSSDCTLRYKGIENVCPQDLKQVLMQCEDNHKKSGPSERRECLFRTIFDNCPDREESLKNACDQLQSINNENCTDFSKQCVKEFQERLFTTTTLSPTTTTSPTTSERPSTTVETTMVTVTTEKQDTNQTNTQTTGQPSSSSGMSSTSSSAMTSTTEETTPEPTTVAATTESTTEPTTVTTPVTTPEATTEAPTTTESKTSPVTTPTSATNAPSTTEAATSEATKEEIPIAPPVQPLITTNPSEDATPIPDPDLSDARQGGSQSDSQGAGKDEEGTNLTPLYAVIGVLAVVLAVVGGIVALVIVRKRRNKKRNEGVESGVNTSNSVNLKGKKKPQPPKAPPAKAKTKVSAKADNNTNKDNIKEANAVNQDQMPAGSLDGFRREGRLVMDVGIHKGEVVEHVTKDDDGKEIEHVVIDPTLNYMVDIGDDVDLVITEEGQEDGGGGEAAKDQKKSERKSAKEKKSDAKSAKEKSGAAAKSTAGT